MIFWNFFWCRDFAAKLGIEFAQSYIYGIDEYLKFLLYFLFEELVETIVYFLLQLLQVALAARFVFLKHTICHFFKLSNFISLALYCFNRYAWKFIKNSLRHELAFDFVDLISDNLI